MPGADPVTTGARLHEVVLPYDAVRESSDPRPDLLDFLQSGYEAGASLAGWDLVAARSDWCPVTVDRLAALTASRGEESG